ncbi:MAG: DNA-methyltransferase [Gammaproteobacteria bacterium]
MTRQSVALDTCLIGDCRKVLRRLIADGARMQMCVTSPPYWGLRDYGCGSQIGLERTPDEYVAVLVGVFALVRELLSADGTLWLNLGDCYATGAGMVGDCPGGGIQGERWKALRPSLPQDCPGQGYRGTHTAGNSGKHAYRLGDGGLTQPNRLPLPGLKPKDLVGIPWRVAFALQADGWTLRSDIIWHKPNPMPESVRDRPTKAHEYVFLLSKSEHYYYDHEAIREHACCGDHARNANHQAPGQQEHAGLRRRGIAKNGNTSRCYGDEYGRLGAHRGASVPWEGDRRNKRSVWEVATLPFPDAHFATFPPALIEPCILAGSREGDIVLDPFLGSGTAAEVAQRFGRRWIGIDLNPAYAAMQRRRTRQMALRLR